jgi:hypothetical protein
MQQHALVWARVAEPRTERSGLPHLVRIGPPTEQTWEAHFAYVVVNKSLPPRASFTAASMNSDDAMPSAALY